MKTLADKFVEYRMVMMV